jgi:hypothetical protein
MPKATSQENEDFLRLLLMFIVTSGSPFRIVENPYFVQLCTMLVETRKAIKLPSRRTIKRLLNKEAEKKRVEIKKTLSSVKHLSITTDCWSSTKQKTGYIGVTVHFCKKNILHSLNLGIKQVIGIMDFKIDFTNRIVLLNL